MEGLWETTEGAPLVLFGIPDKELRENRFAIEIPKMASLILTHELDGEVKGIDAFDGKHPPVAMVFWSFRIMVATGILMLVASWYALWALRRQREPSLWLSRGLVAMTFSGWIAVLSGWYTTEIGRQPYLVQGVMTTADALGPTPAGTVLTTLVAWLVLYGILISAYIAVVFGLARNASRLERLKPGASAHGPQVGPLVHPHASPSNA
jgi:cytochrome d ubiquinol oxidase subunit I